MYGNNKVAHQDLREDGALAVNSIFPTLQGEGPDAGVPAIFVRLQGCNLRCWFCDTEFETGKLWTLSALVHEVREFAKARKYELVVITGGEPFLQNFIPLVSSLNYWGLRVSVETAGTVYIPGTGKRFVPGNEWGNLIVCSPKTPDLNPKIIPIVGAWKYIVTHGDVDTKDGLPIYATQDRDGPVKSVIFRPPNKLVPIYIQPCDAGAGPVKADLTARNIILARDICLNFGYRLSIQLHKIVDVP